jgi:hypothetical protein
MDKAILFVFNPDPMCFIHVLLNALDMESKGVKGKIVMEGGSVELIPELSREDHMLHKLWTETKEKNLVEGVCKACANKLGTLDAALAENLSLLDDMRGHPSMTAYRKKGYEIITF